MKKEHLIRPIDAKEYINFQFQGLVNTLEQFDYSHVASIVRATQTIFDGSMPQQHSKCTPECSLLDVKSHLK